MLYLFLGSAMGIQASDVDFGKWLMSNWPDNNYSYVANEQQFDISNIEILWGLQKIWQPCYASFGNPEKQISYSCILDDADTDSDAFLIFRVTIYLFVVQ